MLIIRDIYNVSNRKEAKCRATVSYWEQVLFSWLIGNADMHLKNYSLYAPEGNEYQLTPAYDLLSTALVIPEDTEELALTLCGKKRKLTRQHFLEAMTASRLDEKVCDNIFARFQHIHPEWEACIRQSFLPEDMQRQYIEFILLKFSQI
ncbi:HipA domain-containing protein [Porphyromonas sp. COT-290 OH3588]|uniref:HipA domain-containing protein n=1 Tax=Porphyromonas sp. COT-290 OH3588 TaxID=1515617 RepID=UPI001F21CAA2|nr:HipA domain-containing protein [Porphyromonas sp. COT-290 OH3588]